jgi:hypothetical protein
LDDLILKHAFTESAAQLFLKVYDETVGFAALREDAPRDAADETDFKFQVGDLVNWESGGQLQWRRPRKVVEIVSHEDGQIFLKVEGPPEDTGAVGWIPLEEAMESEAAKLPPSFTPPPPDGDASPDDLPRKGQRKAVFPVSDGDVTILFPENISADGLSELDAYLAVFLKRETKLAAT